VGLRYTRKRLGGDYFDLNKVITRSVHKCPGRWHMIESGIEYIVFDLGHCRYPFIVA